MASKIIIENKKLRFHYEVLEVIEAGIVLLGAEVKSLRLKNVSLQNAYAYFHEGEMFVANMQIKALQHAAYFNVEVDRHHKLLLKKREIFQLAHKTQTKGLALLPLKIYFNARGKVKLLLALAKGKKKHDKREDEKARSAQKEIMRGLAPRSLKSAESAP